MIQINYPIFCITSDVDWASEHCITDFQDSMKSLGVKPTLFATHKSASLQKGLDEKLIEVGLHPNFMPESTQGKDYDSIIESLMNLFPDAKSFRSHCFFDNTLISRKFFAKGIKYDSNICSFLQEGLQPIRLSTSGIRFPVFWEDDVHWLNTDGNWDVDKYLPEFLTPGLKILNVHPFNFAANTTSSAHYKKIHSQIQTLDATSAKECDLKGAGTRTFTMNLIAKLKERGERFYTLSQLHDMVQKNLQTAELFDAGRNTKHSDEEYKKYWSMSNEEKQAFLKDSYEQRNADDLYATSRDYNMRELEISSIYACLNGTPSKVLDIGCGNGYTAISLASKVKGWHFTGVDFSENLINAANKLKEQKKDELHSQIDFVCADALKFLDETKENSFDYLITERFIQNMPSKDVQLEVVKKIQKVLKPGGKFLMCEGSDTGFEKLNELRAAVGLEIIPKTSADNISAIRIEDSQFEDLMKGCGFKLESKEGYPIYFIISRMLHPLLMTPQSPRFQSKINDLAGAIQRNLVGKTDVITKSGIGSNTLWVLKKESK